MRSIVFAALTASLAGAAPAPFDISDWLELTAEQVSDFGIANSDGMTFRIHQHPNKNFKAIGIGPRSYLKALGKYASCGATIDPQLVCVVDSILHGLGLAGVPGADGADCAATGGGGGQGGGQPGAGSGGGGGGGGGSGGMAPNVTISGNGTGEVTAVPQDGDVLYLSPVQIGTPPQELMLDIDTASSDLWVFSNETTQAAGQRIYDIAQSSTAQSIEGGTWQIQYGDGSTASGNVYTDVVEVGGVVVQNQTVESATTASGSFLTDMATSGLLGLGMDSVNQVTIDGQAAPQKTFFSNSKESLAMPLFSVNLKAGAAGNYNFGFIDQTEFTGSINFVPVNDTQGYWGFDASGYIVGDGQPTQFPHEAIADTGTTLLLMPLEVAQAYYAAVPSASSDPTAGGFVFDCGETLPSFTIVIGGYQAVIPGEIMNLAPVSGTSSTPGTMCFGGLQGSRGIPFAIYGDVFLKAQFTVFDGGSPMRIGFAPKSGN